MIVNISKWFDMKRCAFSSSWDDMTMSSIYDITDESNKRDIKTTIYINGDNKEWRTDLFLGNDFTHKSDLIFNNKIRERLKHIYNLGNEIGNHTYSHVSLKKMNYGEFIKEVEDCKRLISSITGQKYFTFCYPHGHTVPDRNIINYLKHNFISCRGADYAKTPEQGLNYIDNGENLLKIKTIHVGTFPYEKDLKELNNLIDRTRGIGEWLVEYGHGWDGDAWCSVDKNMLLKHYDYIKSYGDIWCDTICNISKYIIQRKNIRIQLSKNEIGYEMKFSNIKNDSPITLYSSEDIEIYQDNEKIKRRKMDNIFIFNMYKYNKCVIKTLQ